MCDNQINFTSNEIPLQFSKKKYCISNFLWFGHLMHYCELTYFVDTAKVNNNLILANYVAAYKSPNSTNIKSIITFIKEMHIIYIFYFKSKSARIRLVGPILISTFVR
jgi:hypothetical protein